ncbi:MAG: cyclic nucleotide-binding domain-containing protein [Treponema sp.]|jgi:TolA-binding protein|nr:cyclic nucleotide-binding domain-containing protein [Treponema sp.]
MPKALQFRPGAVIYFQGDRADKIFLLQKGVVNLSYQDIETAQDIHETVQGGEFFGVKSALGKYPREENAMAMAETTLMVFSVPEFEQVAAGNIRIILKMLKVFSTQMRRVHKQLSSVTESGTENPESGLFKLGEYYIKNRRFSEARYVCSRYLTYYPAGKFVNKVSQYLEAAELYLKKYGKALPAPNTGTVAAAQAAKSDNAARAYYDAVNIFSREMYQEAFAALQKIVTAGSNPEYVSKSVFDMGRCIFFMGKYEECIRYYTQMLIKYPKHPDMADVLFFMGQCHDKLEHKDQAVSFYKKVIALAGDDNSGSRAKAQKALAALGA